MTSQYADLLFLLAAVLDAGIRVMVLMRAESSMVQTMFASCAVPAPATQQQAVTTERWANICTRKNSLTHATEFALHKMQQ
jgi:hypothetical protein